MTEAEFIEALRTLPLHPRAQGLLDDAATLAPGSDTLVLSTDTMVEGVHFPADMPAADVAWRLVAAALSDLAAKGAVPVGVMLNYPLRAPSRRPSLLSPSPAEAGAQSPGVGNRAPPSVSSASATGPRPAPGKGEDGNGDWDTAFLEGLAAALTHFAAPLLGGDTVSLPADAPRVLTLTAIGEATVVPQRSGAKAGHDLYVTGAIGAALLGFEHPESEPNAYRRPIAQIADGIALAPYVTAMMDVSDGLLLDAQRMAAASNLALEIALDAVPVPPELAHDKLRAVTWGDDYQLLFALAPGLVPAVPATRIGRFATGTGLTLSDHGRPVALPVTLGYQHNS